MRLLLITFSIIYLCVVIYAAYYPNSEELPPYFRCQAVELSGGISKVVTFTSPTPNTNYEVFLNQGSLLTTLTVTAKTTNGFTLNFTLSPSGTVSYAAIGQK